MQDGLDLELEQLKIRRMQQLMAAKDLKPNISYPEGIIHLTDSNFDSQIKSFKGIPIFIDYWADWCRPCKLVAPVIDALEKKYRGKMIFAKLDTDRNPRTAQRFRIYSIPTFHILFNEKIIESFSGALSGQQFEMKVKNIISRIENQKKEE